MSRRKRDPFSIRNEVFADGTSSGPGPQPWNNFYAALSPQQQQQLQQHQQHQHDSRTEPGFRSTSPVMHNSMSLTNVPQDWVVAAAEASMPIQRERRVIKANPGAAEVWLAERRRGAPWRERAERLQQVEDEKAKREHAVKRVTLLAKQTCQGLKSVYDINYDASEMGPVIADAMKEIQKPHPNPKDALLVKAVQRYDLKAICNLMGLRPSVNPSAPPPNLSIMTKAAVRPKP